MLIWLLLAGMDLVPLNRIPLSQDYELYSRKTRFAVSDEGVIAILDRQERRIIFLPAQGEGPSQVSGQRGEGPGEFSRLETIQWWPPENVFLVVDRGNDRISKWSERGVLMGEVTFVGTGPRDVKFSPNGPIFFSQSYGGPKGDQHFLYKKSAAEAEPAVFWRYQFPSGWKVTNLKKGEPRPYLIYMHWDVDLRYGLGSDFICLWPHDEKILLVDLEGQPMGPSINLEMPRYSVTKEQLEHMLLGMRNVKIRDQIRQHAVIPDHWPAVKHLLVDDQDRIWVFGFPKQVFGDHPFAVFDKMGNRVGEGHSPDIAQVVKGELFYSIHRDEEELIYLDSFRLVSNPSERSKNP